MKFQSSRFRIKFAEEEHENIYTCKYIHIHHTFSLTQQISTEEGECTLSVPDFSYKTCREQALVIGNLVAINQALVQELGPCEEGRTSANSCHGFKVQSEETARVRKPRVRKPGSWVEPSH